MSAPQGSWDAERLCGYEGRRDEQELQHMTRHLSDLAIHAGEYTPRLPGETALKGAGGFDQTAALSLQVTDGGPACARVVRASRSISTSRQQSFSALHMVLDQVASSPTRRLQGGSAGVVVCNASRVEAFHG